MLFYALLNSEQQLLTKSSTADNTVKEQHKATRDVLKAKYQEKEYKATNAIVSTTQSTTQQAHLKTLERSSFSSFDETPKKVASQANQQKLTPEKEKKKSLISQTST